MKPRKPIDKRPKCRKCGDRFVPMNNNLNQKHCLKKDECIAAHVLLANQLREKTKKQQKAIARIQDQKVRNEVYSKEYRKELAVSCQKLARMIDQKFGHLCIDCGKPYGNQTDGGHFHSRGSNASLSYNLHNIHSQTSKCNQFDGGRRLEYYRGLVARYGQWYADYVDSYMVQEYPVIKLSNGDVWDKLCTVKRLIRNFDVYIFTDGIHAREQMNTIIGIYTKSVYSFRETNQSNNV